ncbi:MAG: S-layer homology domain-containing protein [Acidimicrobiales bacterium]|nr:S-layer homology domain-containing protein [Acidimicrobiales bacterium]
MAHQRHGGGRVVVALVVLAVVSAGIASITRPDRPAADCPPGTTVVATVDGTTLCTHGVDPGATLVGPAADDGASGEAATPRAIACIGNGTSGARVQAVYARGPNRRDRFTELLPEIRAAAADVEHLVNRSASRTGGERHVRWQTTRRATDPTCSLDVARVAAPRGANRDFGALVQRLADLGLDRHDRKYLIWLDTAATSCRGIATLLDDDRPGQDNFNNTSVGYARVDDSCLAHGGAAETHELIHLLGAVQRSAPHASAEGHCTDEWDLLCYDDDGPGPLRTSLRCPNRARDRRLDCGSDDYFSTAPGAGSYLAAHWNSADSRFLEAGATDGPGPGGDPPVNDAFSAAPVLSGYAGTTPGTLAGSTREEGEPTLAAGVAGTVWYKWRPKVTGPVSVDTRGSTGDTAIGVFTGSDLTALTPVGTNDDATDLAPRSRVTFSAVAGTTYRVAVGGRGPLGPATLRWGPPPSRMADVLRGARNETAVDWSVAFGVMPGWPDRTWRPRDPVTRGRGIAVLWRMLGEPEVGVEPPDPTTTTTAPTPTTVPTPPSSTTVPPTTSTTASGPGASTTSTSSPAPPTTTPPTGPTSLAAETLSFADVGPGAPYRAALEWAVATGVVADGDAFGPREPLTREDLVTWAWAATGRAPATEVAAFTDVNSAAPFRPALAWAAEHDLVGAYADGTFRAAAPVTRSKLALGLFALAQDPGAWGGLAAPPPTVVF